MGVRQDDLPNRHPVMLALDRIARMMPELAERAHDELIQLARNVAAAPQKTYVPRPLPTEIEKLLAPRPQDVPWD